MGHTEDQTDTGADLQAHDERLPVLKLLFSPSPDGPMQWSVGSGQIEVGRDVKGSRDIRLPLDRKASSRHARIWRDREELWIQDLGSRNKTFVNGYPVDKTQLSDGNVVRIGDTLLLLRWEPLVLPDAPQDLAWLHQLISGSSPAVRRLRYDLALAAPGNAAILVGGESGTGKDLASQAIHRLSGRRGQLVVVNCSTVPLSLAESVLFGHVEGAFTGAKRSLGRLREADGGTLFLDELGDLPSEIQPKLLRVLEDGCVLPIGSSQAVSVQVRVVSATNRNLRQAALHGDFRPDLLARLSALHIELPPLRSRQEDILPLFRRFLDLPDVELPARLAEALLLYRWPLNIRELAGFAQFARTFMLPGKRLDILRLLERIAHGTVMDVQTASQNPSSASDSTTTKDPNGAIDSQSNLAHEKVEKPPIDRDVLLRLMREHNGVIAYVATALKRSRRQVARWLEVFGIDASDFRRR